MATRDSFIPLKHPLSLRYFHEVARAGSFRKAADQIHVAASAINRHVKSLEQEMGTLLFERGKGRAGLKLTAAGEVFQYRLKRAMAELGAARTEVNSLLGLDQGIVNLGVNEGMLYFSELECGRHVLRAMAMALDADENFFVGRCEKPYTNMRLVHYPPQDPQRDAGIGASAHSDRGIITLLLNDTNGGLHVETAGGDWIDAPPDPEAIIVNVGDLMTRWTNGRFRSAIHRVVNESGRERYSIPQFHHPSYRAVVDPSQLPGAGASRYEPVVAGEFVAQGLQRDRKSWSAQDAQPAVAEA